jgi:hypothetical protein
LESPEPHLFLTHEVDDAYPGSSVDNKQLRESIHTMSGFEIAGIILAAFPLILQGLESVQRTAQKIKALKDYDVAVRKRIRAIRIEADKFQHACNLLSPVYDRSDKLLPSFIEDTMIDLKDLLSKLMDELKVNSNSEVGSSGSI